MTPSDPTDARPVHPDESLDPPDGISSIGGQASGAGSADSSAGDVGPLYTLLGVLMILVGVAAALVAVVVVVAVVVLALAIYAVIVVPLNLLLLGWALVSGVFYWLKTRIDGKAIMKRRLEGRIPLLKQTAIELGLDLVELELQRNPGKWPRILPEFREYADEPGLSRAEIRMYRRRFGFEEQSTNPWFTLWLPLLPQLRAWIDGTKTEYGHERENANSLRTLLVGLIERTPGLSWILKRDTDDPDGPSYMKAFGDVAEGFLGFDGGDRLPFLPHTRWVYDTMFLLNTAESSMRRSMVTAYEAYLKAKRDIVEGEYIYHEQKASADTEPQTAADNVSAEQFLQSEAGVVLYGLDEYDERTRMIVTDILCGSEDDRFGERDELALGDVTTVTELKEALAKLPDTGSDPVVATDEMTLTELKEELAKLPHGGGGSDSAVNDEMTLTELRHLLTELNEHRTREFQQLKLILEDIHEYTERAVPTPKKGLTITELKQALEEIHEFRLQEYRRFEVLRINILMFVGLPVMSLIGILLVAPSFMDRFPSLVGETLVPLQDLLTPETLASTLFLFTFQNQSVVVHPEQVFFGLVLGFGALGAALSGMQKIEHDSGRSESLESILGYWLALVRMSIGAISAFVVLVFLSSGLVDPSILSLPLVLGISAASGVSERLALRAISSFESRALPKRDATSRKKAA